jgi:Protein of unknown function (DUF2971)
MKLYKYVDADSGLRFLRALRLRFTPPKYFNDINEVCPLIVKHFSHADFLQHFCGPEYIEPVYRAWKKRGRWTGTYDEFVANAKTDRIVLAEVADRVQHACSRLQSSFKSIISEHTGVCCLSEIATSNLMWAHYADSHRGLCFELDFKASNLNLIDFKPVRYRNAKVQVPPWFLALTEVERNAHYAQILFSKGEEWKYELEHRLVTNLEVCKEEKVGGKRYYYQEIDQSDIKAVIVGVQSTLETEVRRIAREKALSLSIQGCIQDPMNFSLRLTT